MILVVATLILALVGCGYDYTKDDLGKYASYADGFNKAAFDAALKSLVIEDGDFGAPTTADGKPNPQREEKILENIYTALVGKVDTKDEDLKKTEGKLDKNDLLYFCYYATFVKDGKDVIVYPSQMKVASATSIKLGSNELAEGLFENLAAAVLELMGEAGELDFADYAYSIDASTSTESKEGDVAYISYTKTVGSEQTVVNYEKVTLSDTSENPVAKKLVGKKVGASQAEWTEGEGESAVKYTSAKILWIVKDEGTEISVKYAPKDKIPTKDVAVGTTSVEIPANTTLTYHVFPVYYYEVAEYSAEEVLKSLIKTVSKDSLDCLKDCEDLIKTFNEKVTALTAAEKAYDEAVDAKKNAETALETAEDAAKKKGEAEGKSGDDLTAYIAADATVVAAKSDLDAKAGTVTTKEGEKSTATTARDDAMKAIFKKVGAEDEAAGKTKIENEYKESVKDTLTEAYNAEIKENLAKAIWELMEKNVKVSSTPKKAVKEVYERMYESHEYTFYTGSDSSKESYYSLYNGRFKEYLKTTMGANSFKEAKEKLRAEAEAYVTKIVIIYYVAEQYDQTYTKAEIKEYKKDENGDYSYNEYYQGETNTLVAYQFDKLMNYFLTSTTNEETGDVTYSNIVFTTKAASDEHEGHDHD